MANKSTKTKNIIILVATILAVSSVTLWVFRNSVYNLRLFGTGEKSAPPNQDVTNKHDIQGQYDVVAGSFDFRQLGDSVPLDGAELLGTLELSAGKYVYSHFSGQIHNEHEDCDVIKFPEGTYTIKGNSLVLHADET